MENKQIIIDGVNVSGCKYLMGNKCLILDMVCSICSNCHYKQLQREKQSSQEARDTAIKEFNRAEELKTLLNAKEQKLIKIKQYIEDNEWCILDETYKDLEQIIESKEGDNL